MSGRAARTRSSLEPVHGPTRRNSSKLRSGWTQQPVGAVQGRLRSQLLDLSGALQLTLADFFCALCDELKGWQAALGATLYGEILILRNEAARLAIGVAIVSPNRGLDPNAVIQLNQHFVDSHTLSEPLLHKTLVSKLGLLNLDTMTAIIKFYNHVETARSWLPLLGDVRLDRFPDQ